MRNAGLSPIHVSIVLRGRQQLSSNPSLPSHIPDDINRTIAVCVQITKWTQTTRQRLIRYYEYYSL